MSKKTADEGTSNENVTDDTVAGQDGTRRTFLKQSLAGLAAGAAMAAVGGENQARAHGRDDDDDDDDRHGPHSKRILIKDGVVLSMDPAVGDFAKADVLIDGKKIVAVRPNIKASGAKVIDASGMIVIPGMSDCHRHTTWNAFHMVIPNATWDSWNEWAISVVPHLTPEDVYAATLLSSYQAINSGVTCMHDLAHIAKTPEHVDAGIRALFDSGIRGVYGYASPRGVTAPPEFPQDIRRVKTRFFSSDDQLVSLRFASAHNVANYALAREIGVPIMTDGNYGIGTPTRPQNSLATILSFLDQGLLGPDVTFIHGNGLPKDVFGRLTGVGLNFAMAPTSEMTLRNIADSTPIVQHALDFNWTHKMGYSTDVETYTSANYFDQLHAVFLSQRMLASRQYIWGEVHPNVSVPGPAPDPMTVYDVLKMATVGGASANHVSNKAGSLTPGKEADIVLIQADDISMGPLNNAYGQVVTGASVQNVDTVIIGGKIKKRKGKLVDVDVERILKRARASRDRIASTGVGWQPSDLIKGR